MPKIIIIDGNSLLFRAYYATAFPGVEIMRNKDGIPTNAVFAFSNMMLKIMNELKENDGIFVAFDAGKHNFRHDALETYKANRKPAPEDLVTQFPIVREFLKSLGIFQFEEIGFEGDDIAGSVAKLSEKSGYEVHLFTSDRDFLQLADDHITIHILKKGLSDVLLMTPSTIEETYGFKPLQIIDYKGLRGDSSDNLPGIPGIGEKTAVKLINEYGSFDNIIANVDNIKGKLGENIKANIELGKISRDLAIIKTDIELPFKTDDLIYKGFEFKKLNNFCQKYDFKSFISKINPRFKVASEEFNIDIKEVTGTKEINLSNGFSIALDYDNEQDYTNSEIYGISIFDGKNLYYLEIDSVLKDNKLLQALKDPSVPKLAYDFKAIKVNLNNLNIEINGLDFDILIASYLLDSSLKNNIYSVFNYYDIDLSTKNESPSLFVQGNKELTAKVAYFSYILKNRAIEQLKTVSALELYNDLELPLVITLSEMEIEGFPLDVNTLDELGKTFQVKADDLKKEIYEMAGEEFNLSSPKQVGDILFNKLGLKANKSSSTSFENLKDISYQHPIIEKILNYRKYFKLISTYIEGLKKQIHSDKKIHTKFNQAMTATGRLSSSDPNLQNISIRDEEGKLIRKAFHYDSNEYEILSLDYSQIELRILASLSKCEPLKNIFKENKDIHSETAKTIFNLSNEPTSMQRRRAKTVNFGIVYGISDWGLAEQLELPVSEAKEIIANFYNSFPEIPLFFRNIITSATTDGYVSTLFGRRRYIRELHDSSYQVREFAKRAAMNAPIQGTAADLIKLAMIKVDQALKENKLKTKLVLQIHDELIFKVPKNEKEIVYPLVKNIMEHAIKLDVPLLVDGGFGATWYDAK